MEGWMDIWMGGWIYEYMDGWVGVWMDNWVGGCMFDHSLTAIAAASIHVHDSMMMTMTLLGDAQQ